MKLVLKNFTFIIVFFHFPVIAESQQKYTIEQCIAITDRVENMQAKQDDLKRAISLDENWLGKPDRYVRQVEEMIDDGKTPSEESIATANKIIENRNSRRRQAKENVKIYNHRNQLMKEMIVDINKNCQIAKFDLIEAAKKCKNNNNELCKIYKQRVIFIE